MPSPREGEDQSGFISRCMSSKEAQNSFPDQKQRVAFCHSQWRNKNKGKTMYDIINEADEAYRENKADEDAGYPPNCKPGYVEKGGKCVPAEESAELVNKNKNQNKKKD